MYNFSISWLNSLYNWYNETSYANKLNSSFLHRSYQLKRKRIISYCLAHNIHKSKPHRRHLLRVNPLLSKYLFRQCMEYAGRISPYTIHDDVSLYTRTRTHIITFTYSPPYLTNDLFIRSIYRRWNERFTVYDVDEKSKYISFKIFNKNVKLRMFININP